MHFKIHRGTKEIGGSCVEIWTENTRIVIDFGMPIVEKDGSEFDMKNYNSFTKNELINKNVLPDIPGLYDDEKLIDGIVISHAHLDHFGLVNYVAPSIKHYMGEATHKLIQINTSFTPQNIHIKNPVYFKKNKSFKIGDFTLTPYWMDHSAFDAYAFLIETEGKSVFYSGDFRSHGRKAKVFKWFIHNAPKNVDYILLEGTTIGRKTNISKSEVEIQQDFLEKFKESGKINLVYPSGQNIDRLVSIYKACKEAKKILVVDVYVAYILRELSGYAGLPYPSNGFENIKVFFSYYTSKRLSNNGNKKVLYSFKKYKVTKDEISLCPEKHVMIVRPSMKKDIEHINNIDGGNIIYSLWEGYLKKQSTKQFIQYLESRGFTFSQIHTSGHADFDALNQMVEAIKPKYIVPIHTFEGSSYETLFTFPVLQLKDRQVQVV